MQPARHCRTSRASEREASNGDTQTPGARSRLGGGAPSGHSRPATTFGVRQGGGALGYSAVQHCLREPREGKLWYAAVGACAQLPHVWYACTVGCEDRRREVTSGRRAGAIQTCKRTWLLGLGGGPVLGNTSMAWLWLRALQQCRADCSERRECQVAGTG